MANKLRTVDHHTPGVVRYFTYYLEWPDGSEPWVDQVPIVHDLQFSLQNSRFNHDPSIPAHVLHDLARTGEAKWQDNNGVTHRVIVEKTKRNRRWGVKRK